MTRMERKRVRRSKVILMIAVALWVLTIAYVLTVPVKSGQLDRPQSIAELDRQLEGAQ